MVKSMMLALVALTTSSMVFAVERASNPTADRKGGKDHALLKRYDGSFIVAFDQKAFAEFVLPLSRLEEVPGKKDHKNVRAYEPKQKKALEGPTTRLVYVIPQGRSPLEVLRNYQEEIRAKGGKLLYECKAEECGGKPQGRSEGWAGHMTLARFLYPDDRITDPFGSNGWCAMTRDVADARYAAAELPASGAHVSVYTYTLKTGSNQYCQALNDRTIAIVDVIEAKEREQKMVTVQASEMAKSIAGTGRIALYGIYFDFKGRCQAQLRSDARADRQADEGVARAEGARGRPHRQRRHAAVQHGLVATARCCGRDDTHDALWRRQGAHDAARRLVREPDRLEQDR
jgi:OOP family OmpA-OmpF porin